jgi:hypothetical protein
MLLAYLHPYIGSEFHPVSFATAQHSYHPHNPPLASAYCKLGDSHHRSTGNVFSMKRNPQSWEDFRRDKEPGIMILFGKTLKIMCRPQVNQVQVLLECSGSVKGLLPSGLSVQRETQKHGQLGLWKIWKNKYIKIY